MNEKNPTHTKRIIPIGLLGLACAILAAVFQGISSQGSFWHGFMAAFVLMFLTGLMLYLTWIWAGRRRTLAWMIIAAFLIRLAYGLFLSWGLPRFGYDEPGQQAGFVFTDPYLREESAWDLANSGEPLTRAFSDDYSTDQYGGLLALSALIYRTLSPDAFRPALIIILAAGAMALSVPFLILAVQSQFGWKIAQRAGWILVFYPEGVLLGASQMREPFLILFFSMLFWAGAKWLSRTRIKQALLVFIFSIVGLFLFSFRVGIPLLGVLFLWIWMISTQCALMQKLP